MSSRWYRMYDELLDNPKVQRLSGDEFKAWVNILCLASRHDGVVPPVAEGAVHVYHQYTIRIEGSTGPERDRVVTALREEHQVGSGVYYPIPNHRLPSLAPYAPGLDLPETEKAAKEVISLPVHPSLTQEDLDRIVEAVNTVVKAGA